MNVFFQRMCLLFTLWIMGSNVAMAQFNVSGTVTDSNDETLIGVSVAVKGTAIGTITDIDGSYSLDVPGDAATLVYSYIGYSPVETVVTSASGNMDVQMRDAATVLDAIVVTGLASNVKRSNSANSVASISAAELNEVTVTTTTDAALYGKFTGAEIRANSGAPGGGLSVRLRGTTSINGSSQPLFIIDGVYIDNSSISAAGLNDVSAASSGGSQSSQDNPSNRLADIDPEDIETIEILKGASAAAIYGSRASAGVVIINTKKGRPGPTEVQFSQAVGWTQMLNPLGNREWTEERVLASSRFADDIDNYRAAVANGTIHDYESELYGNKGLLSTSRLSFRGGSEKTTFFLGGTYKNEEGIVPNTGYEKASARFNLNHKLTDWLDISTTSFYVNSSADRGFFNNDNSGTTMGISFLSTPTWAQLQADENGIYPDNPYGTSNFLQTADLITNNESVNRFIGGGLVTAKLFSNDNNNLKLILRGGFDYYNLHTTAIFPNSLQFQKVPNGGGNGLSAQTSTISLNANVAAFLVHSLYTDSGLSFRTQIGVTQENFNRNTIGSTGRNLIGIQTNVDQSGARNNNQGRLLQQDKGFFAQEEVNWEDKVIFTLGLRGDKSSNNSDVNKLFYYPKASLALNVHEFMGESSLSTLKLRGAFGQAGNFPAFGAKFTPFNTAIVDGLPGVTIGGLRGNDNVGPERQTEIEFGTDIGLLNNRILLEATYYIKSVENLLLNADISPSSGFTQQVTNAASLENKGIEIGLNANIIRTEDLAWNARLGWWKNDALVTELLVPSFTTGGFADFLGQFRVKQGHSPTEIIGVGPDADEDGLVVYGDAEPDFQMTLFNTVSWKRFDLAFLFHWKQGGNNINLSTLLFDLNETSPDYDKVDLDPDGVLGNGDYRLSQLGANTEPYIEDATYLRLRELGLYYNIPKSALNDVARIKVGFSGTNLLNFFTYNSYDPEVSNFGSGALSTGVEVSPFPSAKRFNFHLVATF